MCLGCCTVCILVDGFFLEQFPYFNLFHYLSTIPSSSESLKTAVARFLATGEPLREREFERDLLPVMEINNFPFEMN